MFAVCELICALCAFLWPNQAKVDIHESLRGPSRNEAHKAQMIKRKERTEGRGSYLNCPCCPIELPFESLIHVCCLRVDLCFVCFFVAEPGEGRYP